MEPRHGIMKAFPKVKRAKVLTTKDAPPVTKKSEGCDITGCFAAGQICFKAFQSQHLRQSSNTLNYRPAKQLCRPLYRTLFNLHENLTEFIILIRTGIQFSCKCKIL